MKEKRLPHDSLFLSSVQIRKSPQRPSFKPLSPPSPTISCYDSGSPAPHPRHNAYFIFSGSLPSRLPPPPPLTSQSPFFPRLGSKTRWLHTAHGRVSEVSDDQISADRSGGERNVVGHVHVGVSSRSVVVSITLGGKCNPEGFRNQACTPISSSGSKRRTRMGEILGSAMRGGKRLGKGSDARDQSLFLYERTTVPSERNSVGGAFEKLPDY